MSNKKGGGKGAGAKEVRQYAVNETVLGKIRGYPPWPGIIVDVNELPDTVANDPGRKPSFCCVQFFPAGDYGWIHPRDLSSLRPHEIDTFLADEGKKRNGDLHEGYSIARDPAAWLSKRKADAEAQAESMDGSDEDAEAEDADADGEGEVDELASEPSGEDGAGKSKKRKRVSTAGDEEPPKKKKAAKAASAKEKEPKAPKAKKEKASTPSAAGKEKKPRASKAKTKALVESEDDVDADGDGEEAGGMDVDDEGVASTSAKKGRKSVGGAKEKKEKAVKESKAAKEPKATPAKADKKETGAGKKDKASAGKDDDDGDDSKGSSDPQSLKVRDWRHKLQKTFLSQKVMPKPEAMKEIDTLFTTVESYDGMTIEQLQFSKIGKVMRHIAAIQDDKAPPLDTDFRFRARAKGLVERWHQILNANKPAGGPAASPDAKKDVSPGKKSGSPSKENQQVANAAEGADAQAEAEVIKATNGIDLNGAEHEQSPAAAIAAAYTAQAEGDVDAAAELDADASMGDITMSEAAA